MHGFVNVFLAAALLWHGGSAGAAIATLEEQSPGEFHFDDQCGGMAQAPPHRGRNFARRASSFAISFGSCSFEEPIADLQRLGWL